MLYDCQSETQNAPLTALSLKEYVPTNKFHGLSLKPVIARLIAIRSIGERLVIMNTCIGHLSKANISELLIGVHSCIFKSFLVLLGQSSTHVPSSSIKYRSAEFTLDWKQLVHLSGLTLHVLHSWLHGLQKPLISTVPGGQVEAQSL